MGVAQACDDAAPGISTVPSVGSSAVAPAVGGSYHAGHKDLVVEAEVEGFGYQPSRESSQVLDHLDHLGQN